MNQKNDISWAEWSPRMINKYHLKKTGKNHYNGPCPKCGGHDRFFINEKNGALLFNCNQGCKFKQLVQVLHSDGTFPERQKDDKFTPSPSKHFDTYPKPYHERKVIGDFSAS